MDTIFALLITYRYLLLFPISIIEGPIISIIAGFLVTLDVFNPFIVYAIVLAGDFVGDTMFYLIGRFGRRIFSSRLGKRIGLTPERLHSATENFGSKHFRTIVISKITHGFGITGLTAAGLLKIPYPKYISICMLTSLFQAAAFLITGIFFGQAYKELGKYLDYFAATTIAIGLAITSYFVYKHFKAKTASNANTGSERHILPTCKRSVILHSEPSSSTEEE